MGNISELTRQEAEKFQEEQMVLHRRTVQRKAEQDAAEKKLAKLSSNASNKEIIQALQNVILYLRKEG
jgi:transcription termination factor Rho